jgi:hypothetical protein
MLNARGVYPILCKEIYCFQQLANFVAVTHLECVG